MKTNSKLKILALYFSLAMAMGFTGLATWSAIAAPPVWQFALIGDIPYDARQEALTAKLIQEINQTPVRFVIHDGDIKGGSTPCTDRLFLERKALFQQFTMPFILIFGDNEWTDCHRESAGGYNPQERLAKLRQVFAAGNQSLGKRTLLLHRQSEDPSYGAFRENVWWLENRVLFIGLHVVGSNNNLGRNAENDAEYQQRNAANLAWLAAGFQRARQEQVLGVVLIMQADPLFELPPEKRTGFNDFLNALQMEVLKEPRPVLLVHGDRHYFRIDKPLNHPDGTVITQFTRLETFGSPNVHWVRVTVDPRYSSLFILQPELLAETLVN